MAKEGLIGGFVGLFAWAATFTTVWALTQPLFTTGQNVIINLRHGKGSA
jgi:hypothetical protein